ncbi:hypothetical protein LL912_00885 [Niabella sp. CC-SYL272]|uniref:hypothetical protein n=1 Tax=Niabella agricola TaxID=2891571 RepID=UPI001F2BE2B5|nr:hypothetical protein [Niabella agricola]MCF3107322.1 hypothetical protein [Niabella agricola]
MPITRQFTRLDVTRALLQKKEAFLNALMDRFEQVGEESVRHARLKGDYQDQTGNLRNSIGYVIFKDGRPYRVSYPNDAKGVGRGVKNGAAMGKALAMEVGRDSAYGDGIFMVVTAGMDYAIYVESGVRGGRKHDVLTSASIVAARSFKTKVNNLYNKLK